MEEIGKLDEAQLKYEFRQLYKDIGQTAATQALYEMLFAANVLFEVIIEESKNGKN